VSGRRAKCIASLEVEDGRTVRMRVIPIVGTRQDESSAIAIGTKTRSPSRHQDSDERLDREIPQSSSSMLDSNMFESKLIRLGRSRRTLTSFGCAVRQARFRAARGAARVVVGRVPRNLERRAAGESEGAAAVLEPGVVMLGDTIALSDVLTGPEQHDQHVQS
jgi:hypothetical protein